MKGPRATAKYPFYARMEKALGKDSNPPLELEQKTSSCTLFTCSEERGKIGPLDA
jgi:hypothetical protein